MKTNAIHNYTGHGWEGDKYLQTKGLPKTEIAKRIKAQIKKDYPRVKVSIRTRYYTGGSSIDLKVVDFGFDPITEQYKEYQQTDRTMPFSDWCKKEMLAEMRYTREAIAIIKHIESIGSDYRYKDSEAQIDYFDTNFYFFVSC